MAAGPAPAVPADPAPGAAAGPGMPASGIPPGGVPLAEPGCLGASRSINGSDAVGWLMTDCSGCCSTWMAGSGTVVSAALAGSTLGCSLAG
jgi:hypothetical protein